MKMTQRRQALTAEISPGRVQAMQSRIMARYASIEDAAKQYRKTGRKPTAKLMHGALNNGR
jgi:hypothetical protein